MKIRLSGMINESLTNGKGLRRVYFSQGCTHNCPGCFNPETQPFEGGELLEIDDLLVDIQKSTYLKGITFSGGDPFQQPEAFATFAKAIKVTTKLSIWSYTGYTYEELLNICETDKHIKSLLSNIDVLVDGKFVLKLFSTETKYRGSSNQRLVDVKASLKHHKVVTLPYS